MVDFITILQQKLLDENIACLNDRGKNLLT